MAETVVNPKMIDALNDQIGNPQTTLSLTTTQISVTQSYYSKVGRLVSIKLVFSVSSNVNSKNLVVTAGMPPALTNECVLCGWDNTSEEIKFFTVGTEGKLTSYNSLTSGHSIRIAGTYLGL